MMWMSSKEMEIVIEGAVRKVLENGDKLQAKVLDLRKEIVRLEIERDKKKEEWDRGEREIEHKIGLERKRQEFEIDQAKRETEVKVREENLAADKERFKGEMDFQRNHLENEITGLRELVSNLLTRLPSAEIIANLGGKE